MEVKSVDYIKVLKNSKGREKLRIKRSSSIIIAMDKSY